MTMRKNDPRHGTVAGYTQHRRAKDKACDPCKRAQNEYHTAYRRDRAIYAPGNALTDGEWRPVKGIMRWFPDTLSIDAPLEWPEGDEVAA